MSIVMMCTKPLDVGAMVGTGEGVGDSSGVGCGVGSVGGVCSKCRRLRCSVGISGGSAVGRGVGGTDGLLVGAAGVGMADVGVGNRLRSGLGTAVGLGEYVGLYVDGR